MTQVKSRVRVHDVKKGLPMKTGESVYDFTRALSDSVQQTYSQKFNITKGKGSVYVCEVFQSSVIFDVYKWDNPDERSKTYAVTYKRSDAGAFSFGDTPQQVQRVTRYEPVSSLATTKSQTAELFKGLL